VTKTRNPALAPAITLAFAALLLPAGAMAQQSCQSFDTGQFPLGHVLTEPQRTQLSDQGPGGSERGTLHCSRDGRACSVLANDGAIYGWASDGTIKSKAFVLDDPSTLPGWKGKLDPDVATQLSRTHCSSFRAEADDTGLSDAEFGLKAEGLKTRGGRDYVVSIFGDGSEESPVMVELSLAQ